MRSFCGAQTLDATGRAPTADEFQSYLASKDPAKREKLIDRLLASDAFVDRWAFCFEDLFRAGGRMGSGLNLFHFWVKGMAATGSPL
jgi:hypothetical protein